MYMYVVSIAAVTELLSHHRYRCCKNAWDAQEQSIFQDFNPVLVVPPPPKRVCFLCALAERLVPGCGLTAAETTYTYLYWLTF